MVLQRLARFFLSFLLLATVFGSAQAQESETTKSARRWDAQLSHIENVIAIDRLDQQTRLSLRLEAEAVQSQAAQAARAAREEVRRHTALSDALGAPPADGTAEPAPVTRRRDAVNVALAGARGALAEAEFARARATEALNRLSDERREELIGSLTRRTVLPLALDSLEHSLPDLVFLLPATLQQITRDWKAGTATVAPSQLVILLLMTALAVFAALRLRRYLMTTFVRPDHVTDPNTLQTLLSTLAEATARSLPPIIGVSLLLFVPTEVYGVTGTLAEWMRSLGVGLIKLFLILSFSRAALARQEARWRLSPFTDAAARALYRAICLLAIVVTLVTVCDALTRPTTAELQSLLSLFYTGSITVFLINLLRRGNWRIDRSGQTQRPARFWNRLRQLAIATSIAAPLAMLAGFTALSSYMLEAVFQIGLIIGLAHIIRESVKEGVNGVLTRLAKADSTTGRALNMAENTLSTARLLSNIVLDILIVAAAVALIIDHLKVPSEELRVFASKAVQGFQVGSYTFSLLDLLLGLLAFVIVWAMTRAVQRFLNERLLPQTKLDMGVRNSLSTAVGYVGVVIGMGLAVSTMGLDLSSLALVAGALSIGIGFGLQAVVSNFVAGLILLIERPVKIGDWVVVNGVEGTVKKINVRATEIDTFQKAAVILPNADMISNAVTNWTHRDILGRVEVAVGVAYGTDVRQVQKLLVHIAGAHPKALNDPAPAALFSGFGADSLDFELRIFISDINSKLSVASDLRFDIYRVFSENNIEIPFRQHDVHLKSDDTPAAPTKTRNRRLKRHLMAASRPRYRQRR